MARVTVEDCIVQIPNRFDLVMVAAQRSRDMSAGGELTIERDDDKNPVIALREIAELTVDIDELQEALVKGLQKHVEIDLPEDDGLEELMSGETQVGGAAIDGQDASGSGIDGSAADQLGMQIQSGEEENAQANPSMGGGFEDVDEAMLDKEG